MNPGHFVMSIARVPIDDLLNSVGAVFAHLLLSETTGVAIGESDNLPQGYVSNIDLDDLDDAPRITDDLHTRLIQSHGGGLFVPFHRTKFRIPWCKIARSPIENGRSQRQWRLRSCYPRSRRNPRGTRSRTPAKNPGPEAHSHRPRRISHPIQ